MSPSPGIQVTWLGHSTFRIVSARGKTVVLDPWLANNPACPSGMKTLHNLDLMILTHGHFDHFEDAVALGRELRPKVVRVIGEVLKMNCRAEGRNTPISVLPSPFQSPASGIS